MVLFATTPIGQSRGLIICRSWAERGALERMICAPPATYAHGRHQGQSRLYMGDRRSPEPFGPYNARYTGDHR